MAIIRRQRRISNVGISAVGVATRIGGSTVPVNTPPEYVGGSTTITFTEGLGGTFALAARYFDAQGDDLTYAAVGTLPAGISLDTDTGIVTIASSLAFGNYAVQFTATDGQSPPVSTPVLTISVVSTNYAITPVYFIAPYTTRPANGVLYNNNPVDTNRGGIIGWCDADHGYLNVESNSVRYYNHAGPTFHGIAIGTDGYLIPGGIPGPSNTVNTVAEEDNYPSWYVPRVDKLFWVWGTKLNSQGVGVGQYGIFDMQTKRWEYGNAGANASQWPSGPYWTDYIYVTGASIDNPVTKNTPSGWSEALDTGVAISDDGGGSTGMSDQPRVFAIEPNHSGQEMHKPYRIRRPLTRRYEYRVNVPDPDHNQFINAACVVGEWLYFIRPAIDAEKALYANVTVDGVTYPGSGSREFFRVRMRFPYNQWQKLAQFPEYEIAYQDVQPVSGPTLDYDPVAHSIICRYEKLWLYDIDADAWANRTPSDYKRVFNGVGGYIPQTREVVYTGGSSPDFPGGTNPATGYEWHKHFHKLVLSGGVKARGRWVRAQLDKVYPGRSGTDIPIGKHRRFKYFPNHRTKAGTLMYGNAPATTNAAGDLQARSTGGYVWVFGGDYEGIPYTQSTTVTNYPTAPGGWATDSGRQDQYRSHVAEVNGRQIMELACNHVAFYPYTGGTPDPNIQLGPAHPDGVGLVCDRDGWIWVGPGYFRFQHATTPPSAGSTDLAMYRFRLPDLAADGVRKGDGWERVPQGTWPMVKNQFGGSNMWSDYDPIAHNVVFATIASDPWKYFVFRFPCSPTNGVHTPVRSLATGATDTAARQRWEKFCNEQVVRSQKYDFTVQGSNTIQFQGHPYQNGDKVAFVDGTTGPGLTQGHNFIVRNAVPGVSFQLSEWANVPLSQIGTLPIISTLVDPTGSCKVRRGVNPTSGGGWTGSQAVVGDYLYSCINSGSTAYNEANVSFIVRFNLRNEVGSYNDYEFIAYHPDFFWTRPFDRPSLIGMGVDTVCELRDMQAMGHLLVIGPPAIECYDTDPWYWYYDTNRRTWTKGETYAQLKSGNSGLPTGYNHAYTNEAGQNIVFNGGTPHVARGLMGTVSETGEMWYWTLNQSGESGVVKVRIW